MVTPTRVKPRNFLVIFNHAERHTRLNLNQPITSSHTFAPMETLFWVVIMQPDLFIAPFDQQIEKGLSAITQLQSLLSLQLELEIPKQIIATDCLNSTTSSMRSVVWATGSLFCLKSCENMGSFDRACAGSYILMNGSSLSVSLFSIQS